jgi:hypothetical protein
MNLLTQNNFYIQIDICGIDKNHMIDLLIRYGRDCVEPAAKPGDLALVRRTRA